MPHCNSRKKNGRHTWCAPFSSCARIQKPTTNSCVELALLCVLDLALYPWFRCVALVRSSILFSQLVCSMRCIVLESSEAPQRQRRQLIQLLKPNSAYPRSEQTAPRQERLHTAGKTHAQKVNNTGASKHAENLDLTSSPLIYIWREGGQRSVSSTAHEAEEQNSRLTCDIIRLQICLFLALQTQASVAFVFLFFFPPKSIPSLLFQKALHIMFICAQRGGMRGRMQSCVFNANCVVVFWTGSVTLNVGAAAVKASDAVSGQGSG